MSLKVKLRQKHSTIPLRIELKLNEYNSIRFSQILNL
jgi:hypothetical protein